MNLDAFGYFFNIWAPCTPATLQRSGNFVDCYKNALSVFYKHGDEPHVRCASRKPLTRLNKIQRVVCCMRLSLWRLSERVLMSDNKGMQRPSDLLLSTIFFYRPTNYLNYRQQNLSDATDNALP